MCAQLDLVFVLDSSGSVKEDNWLLVLEFVTTLVDGLEIGPFRTQVGVVTYSNKAKASIYLDSYEDSDELKDAILEIDWKDQKTNTSGGLWLMREVMFGPDHGDRSRVANLGIVITDGESNVDQDKTLPYAKEARDAGIVLFAVGIGDEVVDEELNGITGNISYVFKATDFEMLEDIQQFVSSAACDIPVGKYQIVLSYLLNDYVDKGPEVNNWIPIMLYH